LVGREQQAAAVLTAFTFLPVTDGIRDLAGIVGEPHLRSLDAIHLATAFALAVEDRLGAFFAYDGKLVNSATLEGIKVYSPTPGP
jgi:predicted nucleic acid-binding protein